jgi:hypothetical protein
MESFERYAGFFPDAALSMMEQEDRNRSTDRFRATTDPYGLATLSLAGGVWADAILPEVMDYLPRGASPAPRDVPATGDSLRGLARRLRRALPWA